MVILTNVVDEKRRIKEGIREGIQENKIQNAINFLKLGIDIETVAKGVNLSIEKIKELRKIYMIK